MKPALNLTLCLVGIVAMIFAAMPVFTGKYVVTETSLETLRPNDVPVDVVARIGALVGREFWYSFTLDAQLRRAVGDEAAAKSAAVVRDATGARVALKDFVPLFSLFLIAFWFWAWAFKQPLAASHKR